MVTDCCRVVVEEVARSVRVVAILIETPTEAAVGLVVVESIATGLGAATKMKEEECLEIRAEVADLAVAIPIPTPTTEADLAAGVAVSEEITKEVPRDLAAQQITKRREVCLAVVGFSEETKMRRKVECLVEAVGAVLEEAIMKIKEECLVVEEEANLEATVEATALAALLEASSEEVGEASLVEEQVNLEEAQAVEAPSVVGEASLAEAVVAAPLEAEEEE